MVVCAGSRPSPLTRRRVKGHIRTSKISMKFLGAQNCRGKADTLKLQSKISNSAAEQTGLRHYMTSKVDCKGVGIVAN